MLTFWANLDESDVEAYVCTLLLPPYMSYLRRAPVHFEAQPPNPDGRQPLRITYLGEGRVEEFFVHPNKHALGLLRSVCPEMNADLVRISPTESIWNWSRDEYQNDGEENSENGIRMRLFFEPTFSTLAVDFPPRFDPQKCYVSVSRKEMFLGQEILQAYFSAWLDRLEGRPERKHSTLELKTISGGTSFCGERLGGEFSLEEGEVFRDLLQFSGLSRSLKDVADLVRLDLENAEVSTDDDGLRFRLVAAQ